MMIDGDLGGGIAEVLIGGESPFDGPARFHGQDRHIRFDGDVVLLPKSTPNGSRAYAHAVERQPKSFGNSRLMPERHLRVSDDGYAIRAFRLGYECVRLDGYASLGRGAERLLDNKIRFEETLLRIAVHQQEGVVAVRQHLV